jgi:uncharacterized membrane protein YczE
MKANKVSGIVRGLFHRSRTKRTLAQKWVIVLGLLVLALGLANLVRAALALRYEALLPDLPMTAPLTYVAAVSGLWGLVLVVCASGLARFHPWGRWGTLAAVTLYQVHVWVNHVLLDANDYAFQTQPRDLALTLLLLALTWGSLNLPHIRKVFEP